MKVQRFRQSGYGNSLIEDGNGLFTHYASCEAIFNQMNEAFERERKLYQSTIDTLKEILKNPLD